MGIEFSNPFKKSISDFQFDVLNKRLINIEGVVTRVRRAQHEQAEIERKRHAQLLKLIQNLDGKVDETMTELSDAVGAIKDDVVRIGNGVKDVLDLLTKPSPDVTAATAALKEADAGLDAAAEAMEAVLNPPAPEDSPAPTEG